MRKMFSAVIGAMAAAAGSMFGFARAAEERRFGVARPPETTPRMRWPSKGNERLYGRSRSWTGLANGDNPAGTKLARKAQKQSITIRKGW